MPMFSRKVSWFFLPLLIILSAQISLDQIPQQPLGDAAGLLKQARDQWAKGYFEEAYHLGRKAQSLAAVERDSVTLLAAMRQAGKYFARNGFLDEAEATLDSLIARADWVGDTHPEIFLAKGERAGLEAYRGNFERSVAMHQALVQDCNALAPEDTIRPLIYQWTGQAFGYVEAYDSALFYCHKALEIFQELYPQGKVDIAYIENALGVLYSEVDQIETSIQHYERASAMLDRFLRPGHSHVIQVRSNAAVLYQSLGLPWKALELYRINLTYLDSLKPAVQYATLFNYASTLIMVGDYHESLRYLDQAEALFIAQPGLRPDGISRIYYARSSANQSLGKYESAIEYINVVIQNDLELFGPTHSGLVLDYMRKGTIYEQMGNYEAAASAMEEALRAAQLSLEPHSMRIGWVWESMGRIQRLLGRPALALKHFAKAEEIYHLAHMEWNLTDTYREMAEAWQHLGNPDSTLAYLQKAWTNASPDLPFQAAPNAQIFAQWTNTQLPSLLKYQGEIMDWRYEQTSDPNFLRAALACYEAFIAVTDSQRHFYEAGESQQVKVNAQRPVIERALARAHELYLLEQDPDYLHFAFAMVEQGKSSNLRDHLRGIQAMQFAGVPDSLTAKEHYFRQRLAAIEAKRLEKPVDNTESNRLQQDYFELYQAYRMFLQEMEHDHPRYYQLKYPVPLHVEAISQRLAPQQALYSYFWGQHEIFLFRIFQDEWQFERIPRDSILNAEVDAWLAFLAEPAPLDGEATMAMAEIGTRLAQVLLPGLTSQMEQLLLIPDGPLGYLPFESLLNTRATSPAFRSWPFLVQSHAITYASAAELWLQSSLAQSLTPASYLGFAPDFGTHTPVETRDALRPLRYNREEVEQVARLLGGRALLGSDAREAEVKNLGHEPHILHFATHALADETQLMQSRLYFEPDTKILGDDDGILHAWEIYALQLSSPLTVLSACQTGKGPLLQGEGVMSLARAFQYGGSRNVLASRWQADDHAGATLTQGFFEELAAGNSASEALKIARVHWLERTDNYHCHPYFWAGYALIGDGKPIQIKQPLGKRFWMLLVGGILLVLPLSYWLYRRKSTSKALPYSSQRPA